MSLTNVFWAHKLDSLALHMTFRQNYMYWGHKLIICSLILLIYSLVLIQSWSQIKNLFPWLNLNGCKLICVCDVHGSVVSDYFKQQFLIRCLKFEHLVVACCLLLSWWVRSCEMYVKSSVFHVCFPTCVCWRSKRSHGEYQYALRSPRFTYTPECQLRPQSPPKWSPWRGPQHFYCRGDGAPPRQRNSETKLRPVQWCHNRLAHSQTQ